MAESSDRGLSQINIESTVKYVGYGLVSRCTPSRVLSNSPLLIRHPFPRLPYVAAKASGLQSRSARKSSRTSE